MKKKIYGILFFVSFIISFYILGAYEQNFIKDKLMVIIVLISLGIAALSAYKLGVVTIPDKEEVIK